MEELTIRRNRSFAVPQRQVAVKAEKQSGTVESQKVTKGTGFAVSETLRQLMSRVSQAADHSRESRRTLQTGEGVLAEVQEKLGRMAQLAEEAAGEGGADRAALQAELEQLRGEIDRMIGSASAGSEPLFLDGDGADAEALLRAVMDQASAKQDAVQALPGWLTRAATQGGVSPERLLAALGLSGGATGAQLLAAVAGRSLESDPAAGYLAALYLGAVIAKGTDSGALDPAQALDGLRQLLEKTAEGLPPDEAIELLTGGAYTSLADFQEQFTGGMAPGLADFLTGLLLSNEGELLLELPTLLDFMAGVEGMDLELMMALLSAGQVQASVPEDGLETAELAADAASDAAASGAASGTAQADAAQPMSVAQLGDFQVLGRDLSAVTYDAAAGRLTVGGTADVVIQGTGQSGQEIQVTGSGTVTLQNVRAAVLTVETAEARIATVGGNMLGEVRLGEETVLTLEGRGLLRAGVIRGGEAAVLRMLGGAAAVAGGNGESGGAGVLTVPVVLDGAASLAAQAASVRDLSGRTLEPMDILWETLLPGFSAVTSMAVDGQQARMALQNGELPDPVRLWLTKGDPSSQGYPAHTLTIRGRDEAGHVRTRYAYLRWEQRSGTFQKVSLYPNPFRVTGGEQEKDWFYEEESHTLHILSGQVTAVSGGAGTDLWKEPFSGRISLMDRIGALKLALGGVVCRVTSGRAFHLGQENEVTLVLRTGSNNFFESGAGCAGISLGEGTSLRIDCAAPGSGDEAAGTLTATGGTGGVGIGQDNGVSRDRSGHIMIRNGMVTGGEKPGEAGSVTIVGSAAGTAAASDLGSAKTWARMGLLLQMGEDAVILPQFPLSSRTLQLNKLRVSTREYARAARMTIDADRRWVTQLQTAYTTLSNRLEQSISSLDSAGRYFGGAEGLVRDSTSASILMREISRSAPILSDRAMQARSLKSLEDVNRLLR